jgi:hypothetical protein
VKLRFKAGPEPALTRDELITIVDRPNQNRLEHSVLSKRISQSGDLGRGELLARLERVRVDQIYRNVRQLARIQ